MKFNLVVPQKSIDLINKKGSTLQKINIDALMRHLDAAARHAEFLQKSLKDIYVESIGVKKK